jgi:hypothetical protein
MTTRNKTQQIADDTLASLGLNAARFDDVKWDGTPEDEARFERDMQALRAHANAHRGLDIPAPRNGITNDDVADVMG